MEQALLAPLKTWESFYVIVGSSSAALTGLQFVVITLSAGANTQGGGASIRAFGTPTIVHFCAALLISAVLSAPWSALSSVGIALGMCGLVGVVYVVAVTWQAWRQTDYMPVLEDWIWHNVLPLIAYTALLMAAIFLTIYPDTSLFVVGGTALLLLFIGIHNAWDAVVYMALRRRQRPGRHGDKN